MPADRPQSSSGRGGDAQRLAGGIGDANEFAALLVPSLVFAAFALAVYRAPLVRLGLVVALGLVGIALLLTQSRGGLVALGVSGVAIAFFAGPLRLRAFALLLCVAALGFFYYTLVAPPESLTRITHFSAGGGTGRSDLWSIALDMWKDRPVLGVGAGNFQLVEPRYAISTINLARPDLVVDTPKVAHNTYLHVLTELGVVGLAAFLLAVVASLRSATGAVRTFARAGLRDHELVGRALVIGAIGMLAAFTFISAQYEKQLWLMLGLLAASSSLARASALDATLATAREDAEPEYDRAVSERLAEQLEQRLAERLDNLALEQERLERLRGSIATHERELRERKQSLERREAELRRAGETPDPQALLAEATMRLTEQLRRLDEREQALAERAAELDARALVIKALGADDVEAPADTAAQAVPAASADELELRIRSLEDQLAAASFAAENAARHMEALETAT